jgi:hypothetical protein
MEFIFCLFQRGESAGNSSVYCAVPRSVSSSGSRSLDLRQVKLAMTQQARRAASGGRVSILKADTKSRSQTAKKSQSNTHVPPHKAETVSSQAKKVGSENTESTSRPKTWPLRVLEVSEFCFFIVSSCNYVLHLTPSDSIKLWNVLTTYIIISFLVIGFHIVISECHCYTTCNTNCKTSSTIFSFPKVL